MNIEPGMTNHVSRKGKTVVKKYKQETIIKGLGKTAIQRMVMEAYFSKLFSKSVSVKPLKVNLNNGETTFDFYNGIPLTVLLKNSSNIPQKILSDIGKVILKISKNKLYTDKQTLKSYGVALKSFIDKSRDILDEFGISIDRLLKYNISINNTFSEFFDKEPEIIIHGDFWLGNLLYNIKNKKLRLIDWEFADAGSIYVDLGTYYCYSLGFKNGIDLFTLNSDLQNHSVQIVRYFAIYRILRIISFVNLADVEKTKISDEFSLSYLLNVLKILLNDIDSFQLDSGRVIMENVDVVTVVFVVGVDGKVLLLKCKSGGKPSDVWEPISGPKKKSEMPLDTAKRELYTKTGIPPGTRLEYLGETNFSVKNKIKNINAVFFTIRLTNRDIKMINHKNCDWFTPGEAIKLVRFQFIRRMLKKI